MGRSPLGSLLLRRRSRSARGERSVLPLIAALLCVPLQSAAIRPLAAQERLIRRFDADVGLYPTSVRSLAQDRTGFLWIGTLGGLTRYDGTEMRRWAAERIDRAVLSIVVPPEGGLVALDDAGRLFEITEAGARPIPLPARASGPGGARVTSVAQDAGGRLWAVRGGELLRLLPDGSWESVPGEPLDGEEPRRVRRNAAGGVDVATDDGVWELASSGRATKLAAVRGVVDIAAWPDGRRILLTGTPGSVVSVHDGKVRTLLTLGERGLDLVRRGSVLWISSSRHLTALTPGSPPNVLGPEIGIEGGGPLLVDREGALWLGTFTGLFEFPEPETRIWTDRQGLPSSHTRFLARTGDAGDTVWVTAWQGTGRLVRTSGGWRASTVREWRSYGRMLVDGRGDLWTATRKGLLRHGRGADRLITSVPSELLGHSIGPRGRVWLATNDGLFTVGEDGTRVRRLASLPAWTQEATDAVLHDAADRLWIARGDGICRAPAAEVVGDPGVSWACDRIAGLRKITALIEVEGGAVWAASGQTGVSRYRGGRWEPHPGNATLPSLAVLNLVRSDSGGVWVLGHGTVRRVRERPDPAGGWEVVERLTSWQGVPITEASDLLEDGDGGLWITTTRGVVHVPAAARPVPQAPPPVAVVEGWVDGRRIPLGAPAEIPPRANGIELRFAALSFRTPSLLRYDVRLSPAGEWRPVQGRPWFRWVHLGPGSYTAEVRASLDGRRWSEAPARFSFTVRPKWYRTPWAIGLFVLAAATLLALAFRARLAYVTGLERQRTRIALDLHDDIGSGLGSIGILSGILGLDGVEAEDRKRLAVEISRTTEELGESLADIVWSLDPRTGTLQDLAARLAEHGGRFFSGDEVVFRTEQAARWPDTPLPLTARRSVFLIGLEALHNAARHSGARTVLLRFSPRGREWEMEVRDDGRGIPDEILRTGRDGRGLSSIRRRAAEIGAKIVWGSPPGGGTSVTLRFAPGGGARRALWSWIRRRSRRRRG